MKSLPAYQELLDAYHKAFRHELQAMIADLPICSGDRVLDVGCGDGYYTRLLAHHIMPGGNVVGMDADPTYLRLARRQALKSPNSRQITFVQGSIERLPFANESFDVIWCAQSLFSFPNAQQALSEMKRVAKSRGVVAVLEDDTLHQVLLPWPVDVELMVRRAEYLALKRKTSAVKKFYVGRNLREIFEAVGLRFQPKKTYANNRQAPLALEERRYLELYLEDLRKRIRPWLSAEKRRYVGRWLNKTSSEFLPDASQLTMTSLDHVMWGIKP